MCITQGRAAGFPQPPPAAPSETRGIASPPQCGQYSVIQGELAGCVYYDQIFSNCTCGSDVLGIVIGKVSKILFFFFFVFVFQSN